MGLTKQKIGIGLFSVAPITAGTRVGVDRVDARGMRGVDLRFFRFQLNRCRVAREIHTSSPEKRRQAASEWFCVFRVRGSIHVCWLHQLGTGCASQC